MLVCFKLLEQLLIRKCFVSFEKDFIDTDFATFVDIVIDHSVASLFISLYTIIDLYIMKAFFNVVSGNVIRANAN